MPKAIDACTPYTKTPSELPRPMRSLTYQQRIFVALRMMHTSDRVPNLSFRRSIQTSSPDVRKRNANIMESRDIRHMAGSMPHISLWYDDHIGNGDGASESGAYDFDELPRDGVGLREQCTGGVLYWRSHYL